jgi:hypothetical protein
MTKYHFYFVLAVTVQVLRPKRRVSNGFRILDVRRSGRRNLLRGPVGQSDLVVTH